MRTMSYREAIREAMLEEMRRDPNVVVFCEDARFWTMPTNGFVDEFGPDRVPIMPISEEGFTGAAIGAAMTGVRPIVDYTIANLMYVAWDQIVNHAAKNRYLFGGQASVPIVFRAAMKYGNATAAQHSDRPYPQLMNVPGLKIVVPSNPADALGLLKSAIRDDDPVVVLRTAAAVGHQGRGARRRPPRPARPGRGQPYRERRHRRRRRRRRARRAEGAPADSSRRASTWR